jgi:23S rRNA (guanosine2251-2'-O)-methyltransferase
MWIWGHHSIEAALERHPELVLELFCSRETVDGTLLRLAQALGLRFRSQASVPGSLQDKRHQGVWAKLKAFPKRHWNDFIDQELPECGQWVLLDRIQDPRNYGAILRSCAAFGVQGVLVRERHQAPLTGVVAQSSAGQLFRVPIIELSSMEALWKWVEKESVLTLALDAHGGSFNALHSSASKRWLWLLGSEGEGLSPSLLSRATVKLAIPMADGVESLNASVAASLAVYEGARQLRIFDNFNKDKS